MEKRKSSTQTSENKKLKDLSGDTSKNAETLPAVQQSKCKKTQKSNQTEMLVFGENTDKQPAFSIYNIKNNQWSVPKVVPFTFWIFTSVAWFRDYIYVFGDDPPTSTIIKFCPSSNTIISKSKLIRAVRSPGVAVMNDYIYIVNGLQDCRPNDVQRYNPLTNTSEELAWTEAHHCDSIVLVHNEVLYVLGTWRGHNSVERYDSNTKEWTIVTKIPGQIGDCSACICDNKLFVVPNYSTRQHHIYDFSSGKWTTKEFTGGPGKIQSMHGVAIDGVFYILAVDSDGVVGATVHKYGATSANYETTSACEIIGPVHTHRILIFSNGAI